MKLKERFKRIRQSKAFRTGTSVFVSAFIASLCCLSCFAAELDSGTTDDMTEAKTTLSSSFDTVSDNVGDIINTAIPYAVGVTGTCLVVRKGISFFTGLAKKG